MRALTLCMIVKDEAELLPRCLDSVEGVVDEIVIVDTGSSDSTRDIARGRGARVIDHAFADDFAAARNAGLAAVTTPWVLVLDADEWLPEGSRAPLVRALSAPSANQAAGFFLNFDNDLGGGRSHVCALLRVFRSDPAVRFRYRIHEQVIPDLIDFARARRLGIPVLENVVVHHDGYLPERCKSKGKDQRNARLFDQQVRDTPDDPYAWYKYADFLRVPREGVRAPFTAKAALERAEAILDRIHDLPLQRGLAAHTAGDAKMWAATLPRSRIITTGDNEIYYLLEHDVLVATDDPAEDRRWRQAMLAHLPPEVLLHEWHRLGFVYLLDTAFPGEPAPLREYLWPAIERHPEWIAFRGREAVVLSLQGAE